MRLPAINFIDDKAGKPGGIQQHMGRRPILAFGNSDGDLQMLQWTAAGGGPRFMGLVHHTDAAREWAYDRTSPIGRLDKALDEAQAKGWTVVDMKTDGKRIFAWEQYEEVTSFEGKGRSEPRNGGRNPKSEARSSKQMCEVRNAKLEIEWECRSITVLLTLA